METQRYVGAFRDLLKKQRAYDRVKNDGNSISVELEKFLLLARRLLCELETAIARNGQIRPAIFKEIQMKRVLKFKNNNVDPSVANEVDDMDSKFAIVRFSEYLHELSNILKNRRQKNQRQKNRLIAPKHFDRSDLDTLHTEKNERTKSDPSLFEKIMNATTTTTIRPSNKHQRRVQKPCKNPAKKNCRNRKGRKNHHHLTRSHSNNFILSPSNV